MKLKSFFLILLFLTLSFYNTNAQWSPAESPIESEWFDEVSPDNALPEYPRPQMKRSAWKNLNGLWQYSFENFADLPEASDFNEKILVPFAVESALSGVGEHSDYLWYRKTFELPGDWEDDGRIKLHFGAVDWKATVYVNGAELGTHKGGYDRFTYDITDELEKEGPQEILVEVFDPTNKGSQPRGKQVLDPGGIWYTPVTGIWQTVWLEPVPRSHITDLKITPDVDQNRLLLQAEAANLSEDSDDIIVARVYKNEEMVKKVEGRPGRTIEIPISNPRLWSPDDPFLYDLDVELKSNDQRVDKVDSYFGIRDIEIAKDKAGNARIKLNGEFIKVIGPLDQGYWPGGLYTAPTDEALKYDLVVTKALGFNMTRKHVTVEPDRWYYWADKVGLLVMQDMPSADNKTPKSRNQYEKEFKEMVKELYNHPSIVNWYVFNEGWGQFDSERLTAWVEEFDESRLVTDASGWQHAGAGDIIDVHRYPGPAAVKPEGDRASMVGEFGGLGFAIDGHTWVDKKGWGYQGLIDDRKQLLNRYEELMNQALWIHEAHNMSGAVYTQITDLETELNGILTYDREIIKMDSAKLAAINKGETVWIQPRQNDFIDQQKISLYAADQDLKIRYTLDGSEPGPSSKLYKGSFNLDNTKTVKARAFRNGEPVGYVTSRTYNKTKGAKPVEAAADNNGLRYYYYEANNDRPEFKQHWPLRRELATGKALAPIDSGTVSGFNLSPRNRDQLFALTFDGYFKAPRDGNYTFYIKSDDDARIKISGQDIFDRLGQSPATNYDKATIPLQEGLHTVSLKYFQAYGPFELQVDIEGPGIEKQSIPADWLFH